ncbi:MAG: NifU family protein, partial [Actinomycetota bacterium]|nr:NifU family protein [Actinomycetota bacterium]
MSGEEAIPYADVLARIAELAEDLSRHDDPAVAAQVTEMLDWIDAFHRDGLGRLVEMIRAWRGEIFLDSAGQDELVGMLLAAYGLGEARDVQGDTSAAVAAALEQVRPVVESHGGAIEVASVRDGVVQVRMLGTCDGCPSSEATLVYGVESA